MTYLSRYTDKDIRVILKDGISEDDAKLETIRAVYDNAIEDPWMAEVAYRMLRDYVNDKTLSTFVEYVKFLRSIEVHPYKKGKEIASFELENFVDVYGSRLDEIITEFPLEGLNFIGLSTMMKSYLFNIHGKFVERPEYMYMRVALASVPLLKVGLNHDYYVGSMAEKVTNPIERTFEHIRQTYRLIVQGYLSPPSPMLFNAMKPQPQLISCFLSTIALDTSEAILDCHAECCHLSRHGAGIATCFTRLRASGAPIGTNGISKGINPVAGMFHKGSMMFDQKGNRKGSWATYCEPWHADIFSFLQLRKAEGSDDIRARNLFIGVMINDLFMERLVEEAKGEDVWWSLMCPDRCPGLVDSYGGEFEALYEKYESEGAYMNRVRPSQLWNVLINEMTETGVYVLFKDACNEKSNVQNLGTITMSNLCTEILRVNDENHTGVCILDSMVLPNYVENGQFNFEKLYEVMRHSNMFLDTIIDNNYFPTAESLRGAHRDRPLGQGVQGLSDTFVRLGLEWGSDEALKLTSDIFETMLYASLEASSDRADALGKCPAFEDSPASGGFLQPDLWGHDTSESRYSWDRLRYKIMVDGLRNMDHIAPMPTATSALFRGFSPAFAPFPTMVQNRKTMVSDFLEIQPTLVSVLKENFEGEALTSVFRKIIANKNSIQNIPELEKWAPLFKTAYEVPMNVQTDHLAAMNKWVCQSTSANLYVPKQTKDGMHYLSVVASTLFDRWTRGFKHGAYYTLLFEDEGGMDYNMSESPVLTSEDEDKMVESLVDSGPKKKFICTEEICTMCES